MSLFHVLDVFLGRFGYSPAVLLNITTPRWGYRVERAIPYGPEARHRMDLYLPRHNVESAPAVLFFYTRTGEAGKPAGPAWDSFPGARGCTPQSCGFRDRYREFGALGVAVYGVSTQETAYQREFVERNHVPFELLSDRELALAGSLRLPTFEYPVATGGPTTLLKRMAWYVDRGRIERIWYPVFPPDRNADTVLEWLRERARMLPGARSEVRLA